MNNSVRKLVAILEPLIYDFDDQRKHLAEKKKELENVSRMLAYTKDNYDMVGVYADQDLIVNNLSKVNSNKDEYRASCYLLNTDNEKVKQLPQYEKAYQLINDIIEYFKLYKAKLLIENQEIEKKCHEQEIEKKYYNIFSSNDSFVDDVKEFNEFLDKYELSSEDKINILTYVLKNNWKEYTKKNS